VQIPAVLFSMKPVSSFLLLYMLLLLTGSLLHAQKPLTELYYSGNYQEVLEASADLISSGDTTLTTYYLKALAEAQLGMTPQAIGTLQQALAYHPGDIKLSRILAGQYFDAGDYVKSAGGYRELIQQDSSDISSWLKLAEIESFRQNYNQAVEALNRVLVLDSMNLTSLMMMGDILNRNNSDGAVVFYKRAVRLYPENQKAAYALGNWYIQSKKAEEAIPICESMLVLDTGSIRFAKLLGYAYYKSGKPRSAIRYLDYATQLGDSTAFTFKFKGIAHYLESNFGAAIGALEYAVQKDSMDAEVHFFLGASLGTIAEMQEAMRHLDKALELMKPDPSVVSRIYSEQGNIKRLEMEYHEAYSLYEKAWDSDSTNTLALYYMASILDNSLHLSKEALTDYERFIEALDRLPREDESRQELSIRAIVEDRIVDLKEELFFRDE
jgi:tetratricopeptide (TPR) repeat protein